MSILQKFVQYTEEHMEETELWMLPYSTLMLTLAILFIMFYAMSYAGSVEYEDALANLAQTSPNDPRVKQMKQEIALAQNIRDFIEKNKMTDKIHLIITPHHIKIKMESFALFDSGSADLWPGIASYLIFPSSPSGFSCTRGRVWNRIEPQTVESRRIHRHRIG